MVEKRTFATEKAVMPESVKKFSVNLRERISKYDMVWGEPSGPPSDWRAGAPAGNGDFGTIVYGAMDNLTFVLGKTDVWDRRDESSHFPGKSFKDVLDAYLNKDENLFGYLQKPNNRHQQHATTCGVLRLHINDAAVLKNSTMRVSIYDGVIRCTCIPSGLEESYPNQGETSVEIIVSRKYKVIGVRLKAVNKGEKFLWKKYLKNYLGPVSWELSRELHGSTCPPSPGIEGNIAWIEQTFSIDNGYVVAIKSTGGKVRNYKAGRRIAGETVSGDNGELLFFVTIVSRHDTDNPLMEAKRRLENAEKAGWKRIYGEHCRWWHKYWKRGYVCLDDRGVEKWWYVSLYLAGSITEPGCKSPGLQGVWIKENVPAWLGDYHSNINIQSVYWGLLTANRIDHMEPYVALLKHFTKRCRKDTSEYFKMKGIRFPHAGGFDGQELTEGRYAPLLGTSIGGSSWLTQILWQIYEYTGDTAYLRDTAYPIMKEVVLFYEDYLRIDKTTGRYVLEPSVHFEAYCPEFKALGRNALYELALVRSAFIRAIKASEELKCDRDDRKRWKDILNNLSDFPKDPESGAWISHEGKNARKDEKYPFNFPPVFPAELVSVWHGPEDLKKEMIATLKDPLTKTGNPWCGGYGIREAIRLGKNNVAFENSRWSEKQLVSGFMPHGTNGLAHSWDTTYLQADHGPGMCSALNDMLILNLDGTLRIFPSIPKDISVSFHSLRAPGAFLVTAEKRGESVTYVVVKSLAGRKLRIANPWDNTARIKDFKTGRILEKSTSRIIEVPTYRGQVLLMENPGCPYKSIKFRKIEK